MRIALMTLKNLMDSKDPTLLSQVLEVGLPRLVKIRSAQSWADEDVPELLRAMDSIISESVLENSSFEKYKAEVLSGNLDWTPMHKQRSFWEVRPSPLSCSQEASNLTLTLTNDRFVLINRTHQEGPVLLF